MNALIQLPEKEPIAVPSGSDKAQKRANREAFLKRPPNQMVTFIKSPFPGREPVLFFPYPPFLKKQRPLPQDLRRIVQYKQD